MDGYSYSSSVMHIRCFVTRHTALPTIQKMMRCHIGTTKSTTLFVHSKRRNNVVTVELCFQVKVTFQAVYGKYPRVVRGMIATQYRDILPSFCHHCQILPVTPLLPVILWLAKYDYTMVMLYCQGVFQTILKNPYYRHSTRENTSLFSVIPVFNTKTEDV
jgi:hypothetical protein